MTFNKLSILKSAILLLIFTLGMSVSAFAQNDTVVDVINSSDDHTILAGILAETELDQTISQPGPFTVMAPTDEAFEALGDQLTQLQQNPDQLQQIVIQHLFQGEVTADEAAEALDVEVEAGDIQASNGVVHSISEVLLN